MTHPPLPRRTAEEQARLDEALRELCERRIVFNQTLGLKVESMDLATGPLASFPMRAELVGHDHYGRLHGGVISAALDGTAGFALMVAQGEKHPHESADQVMARFAKMGTIDLRVDYLRPGIGTRFYARCLVLRLGGRIASTQMRLENEMGQLIATGAGAYVIS